jgi:hypothetical protein
MAAPLTSGKSLFNGRSIAVTVRLRHYRPARLTNKVIINSNLYRPECPLSIPAAANDVRFRG